MHRSPTFFSRELGGQYGNMLAAFVIVSALGALNGWTLVIAELTPSLRTPPRLPAGVEPGERARRAIMGTFGLRGW